MKAFLKNVSEEYFLELDKYSFNPVLRTSTGIALRYTEEMKKSNHYRPFFFTFPNKHESALWISVQYLINIFFHDYIYQSENRLKELGLNYGDKIEIFSTTGYFRGFDPKTQKLAIGFSNGLTAFTKLQNAQFINRAINERINKFETYREKRKEFFNHRKSLSKILELDSNPNLGVLNSKVVLVSGRSKAGFFRNLITGTIVNDEPLSETILLDKNLLISPDFRCFSGSLNTESEKNTEFFRKAVRQILKNIWSNNSDINLAIESCLDLLEQSLKTKKFIDCFELIISLLSIEPDGQNFSIRLQNLFKYHPGIEDDLINNVKAVFVNDLQLMLDNPNTIKYLLNYQIPVFIICDRVITEYKDLDVYKKIFESNEFGESYRFNWDKKKIDSLEIEMDNGAKFIDYNINNSFYQFVSQKIYIQELEVNEFDEIFNSIESKYFFSTLADHEILQKSYYQTLRPLLYTIKNSLGQYCSDKLIDLLDVFIDCFESSSVGLNQEVKLTIGNSLERLRNYILQKNQPKKYLCERENLFFQDISVYDSKFIVPFEPKNPDFNHYNEICPNFNKIVFIGYPFREYSFKFIDESIFKKILPKIDFVLNQCEAAVTINFLKRKIASGYYIEKYPDCIEELKEYIVDNEEQLKFIIDGVITFNKKTKDSKEIGDRTNGDFEEFEQMLNEVKYAEFKGSIDTIESSSQYLLSSNVLHFENGSYVFLPHKWRILTIKESLTGSIESHLSRIDDMAVGDIVVIANVSRKSITKYLEGSKAMLLYMEKLDSWREILKEYRRKYEDISYIVSRLERINQEMKIGGSAENYNVLRWLHDDFILAPAYENLKMVLGLKYPKEELSERAKSILGAKSIILKAKNNLDRAVKDRIAEMIGSSHNSLEDDFSIQVQGIEVKGKKSVIVGIERRSDLKIEYHSTMKFLN